MYCLHQLEDDDRPMSVEEALQLCSTVAQPDFNPFRRDPVPVKPRPIKKFLLGKQIDSYFPQPKKSRVKQPLSAEEQIRLFNNAKS